MANMETEKLKTDPGTEAAIVKSRLGIDVPPDFHAAVKIAAVKRGQTIGELCIEAIAKEINFVAEGQ